MKDGLKNKLQQAFRIRNHFNATFSWLMIRNIQNQIQIQIKLIYMYKNIASVHPPFSQVHLSSHRDTPLQNPCSQESNVGFIGTNGVGGDMRHSTERGKTGETHVSSSSERGSSLLKSVIVSSRPSTLSPGSGLKKPVKKIIGLCTGTMCYTFI